ncbi:MAG: putative penicillin-binding protein, partial [Dehalococcoidia bacterium]|nr:putative penicillin-binding protein [Dehalococcoidia bacterium]
RLAQYARRFGLGEPTGIDLPGEIAGLVPDSPWKEETLDEPWLLGDTYNMGIGQGFLMVTPMQMLTMVSAVANDGVIMKPQIVREVVDGEGRVTRPFTPQVARTVSVSEQNLRVIREGMRQAVDTGTATTAKVPGVEVAGKTGTAEFGAPTANVNDRPTHGWFVGFAPASDPKIAVVVFAQRGNGAITAAPIAGKIMEFYLRRAR